MKHLNICYVKKLIDILNNGIYYHSDIKSGKSFPISKIEIVEKEVIKEVIKEVQVPMLVHTDFIQIGDKVILKDDVKTTITPQVYLVIDIRDDCGYKYSLCMLNNGEIIYEPDLIKVDHRTPLKKYVLNITTFDSNTNYINNYYHESPSCKFLNNIK